MSSEQNIRVDVDLMRRGDLAEVLDIERESFQTPWTEGMFVDELRTKHAQTLVARVVIDGRSRVGGYIIFWMVADEAHLHNLAVRKEFRRQGLARSLMGLMKDIAQQMGIVKMTLEVRETNSQAIALYRKCGFVVKGRRPNYYTDTREAALIMWADERQD
ncbi:MAG: ribosomal protein S18-alanine N-acetyltransferase [Smithellaceae bacterium]